MSVQDIEKQIEQLSPAEFEELMARLAARRESLVPSKPETSRQHPTNAIEFLFENAGTVNAPPDWAEEHDHYLYGTPKRNQSGQNGRE